MITRMSDRMPARTLLIVALAAIPSRGLRSFDDLPPSPDDVDPAATPSS